MLVERSGNQEGNLATEVFVAGSDLRAKIRNPWGVFGLSIITLGIYTIFWWYYVNRELRDLGQAKRVSGLGDNPWLSTAAYIAGGFLFYIPTIWTIVTTTRRIQAAHRVTQQAEVLNGWLAALVWIFTLGFGGPVFTQYQMNRLWSDRSVAQPVLSGASAGDGSGVTSAQELEAEEARVLPGDGDQKGTA
jgi:fatty acid desaturase